MRPLRTLFILLMSLCVISTFAFAAGDPAKGKKLFNDPKAFGGSRSCSLCHPEGKGLETAATQEDWSTPGGKSKTLEDAINFCIVNSNKGKALDVGSEQMTDMVAYIRSLAGRAK